MRPSKQIGLLLGRDFVHKGKRGGLDVEDLVNDVGAGSTQNFLHAISGSFGTVHHNRNVVGARLIQLAAEAAVNPNTMQKALSLLEEGGLLCSKGTLGRFVTGDGEILRKKRDEMRREVIKSLLSQAHGLGISGRELIEYIEKEESENG